MGVCSVDDEDGLDSDHKMAMNTGNLALFLLVGLDSIFPSRPKHHNFE